MVHILVGLQWGRPAAGKRRDIDVTLLAGFGNEDAFIAPILSSGYRGRIPEAAEFARKNRVLPIESPQGVAIDIALGGLPVEALERKANSFRTVRSSAEQVVRAQFTSKSYNEKADASIRNIIQLLEAA